MMRGVIRLLALLVLLAGAAVTAAPWLPAEWRAHLPPQVEPWMGWTALGAGALLWLVGGRRRRRRATLADDDLRAPFAERGFRFAPSGAGDWQAVGRWDGVPLVARRSSGVHANRFGRPFVLVLEIAGRPCEPWPLSPEQAAVVEVAEGSFTVVLPEAGTAATRHRVRERIASVLSCRRKGTGAVARGR